MTKIIEEIYLGMTRLANNRWVDVKGIIEWDDDGNFRVITEHEEARIELCKMTSSAMAEAALLSLRDQYAKHNKRKGKGRPNVTD